MEVDRTTPTSATAAGTSTERPSSPAEQPTQKKMAAQKNIMNLLDNERKTKRATSTNILQQQRSMAVGGPKKTGLDSSNFFTNANKEAEAQGKGAKEKKYDMRGRRNSMFSHREAPKGKRERSASQHGSILEPQNKNFLKDLVKNDDAFTQMFLEGLETTAQQVEDQDKFMQKKQVIFVMSQQFEFTQYDPIFKLAKTQHKELLACQKEKKKFKLTKKIDKEPCFCCQKPLVKKVKQALCHFCCSHGCTDCVYKEFPFPQPDENCQANFGLICRVCETKFYIKIKLDQIFKSIDKKEGFSQALTSRIQQQQKQHMSLTQEIQQQQLLVSQRKTDHDVMCDQLRTKSTDVRDLIERQEKENKKLAQRIAAKKEEYEERSKRLKQLMDEVEKTRRNLLLAQQELDTKQQDKEHMRNYLRQINPLKKGQPNQKSFNPKKRDNTEYNNLRMSDEPSSFQLSQINVPQNASSPRFDHLETPGALDHMRRGKIEIPNMKTSIIKTEGRKNRDKAACEGCSIF